MQRLRATWMLLTNFTFTEYIVKLQRCYLWMRCKRATMEANNTTQEKPTFFKLYITAITTITLIGFLGNALILVVMCNRKFTKTSTSIYLTVLAISDSLTLFSGPLAVDILPSAFSVKVDIRTLHISGCWIVRYLIYWSRHLSSICLISITVERLIAVIKPHK